MGLKKGNLTDAEIQLVLEQSAFKTDAELAVMLNRSEKMIHIAKKRAITKQEKNEREERTEQQIQQYALSAKPFWKELHKQFSANELVLAQYYWFELSNQFGDDITPTEELQMIDIITVQVLINRNLQERQEAQKQLNDVQKRLDQEFAHPPDEQRGDFINELHNQLNFGSAGQQARTGEYKNLLEKKQQLMKDVKGTRDQRYKEIKDSKDTFFTWIKAHNDKKLRQEEAHIMELNKIAMTKEQERLGEYHTYLDGALDRPLLNHETVVYDEKEIIDEQKS